MANHKKKTDPIRATQKTKKVRPGPLSALETALTEAAKAVAELAVAADDVGGSREESGDGLGRLSAELTELTPLLERLQAAAEACDPDELRAECPDLVGVMEALLDDADALVGSARQAADGAFEGAFEGVDLDEVVLSDIHGAADCVDDAVKSLRQSWDERFDAGSGRPRP